MGDCYWHGKGVAKNEKEAAFVKENAEKWKEYEASLFEYMVERWGEPEGEEGAPEQKEPQPAA